MKSLYQTLILFAVLICLYVIPSCKKSNIGQTVANIKKITHEMDSAEVAKKIGDASGDLRGVTNKLKESNITENIESITQKVDDITKKVNNIVEKLDKATSPDTPLRARLDTLARSAGSNLARGIGDSAANISKNLVLGLKGISNDLDPDIQKLNSDIDKLGNNVDSEITKIGKNINAQLNAIKSNINDDEFEKALSKKLNRIRKNFVDSLLIDSTKEKLGIVLTGALKPSIDSVMLQVRKITKEDLPVIQRYAYQLAASLLAIIFGIVWYSWRQRRKYLKDLNEQNKLIKTITYNIHNLPDQKQYDILTSGINKDAIKNEVEPTLRRILKEQGINSNE